MIILFLVSFVSSGRIFFPDDPRFYPKPRPPARPPVRPPSRPTSRPTTPRPPNPPRPSQVIEGPFYRYYDRNTAITLGRLEDPYFVNDVLLSLLIGLQKNLVRPTPKPTPKPPPKATTKRPTMTTKKPIPKTIWRRAE